MAVKKMKLPAWWLLFCKKLHETQRSQSKFHESNIYILIYIYLFIIIIIIITI